ncbi:MAG: hypothetical protein M1828_000737 [Chrysothrix sp. TS-e1954]|nr:MAG: hypothetical protein M1828_000737 [Chrysothrix sp. TS-e1954]
MAILICLFERYFHAKRIRKYDPSRHQPHDVSIEYGVEQYDHFAITQHHYTDKYSFIQHPERESNWILLQYMCMHPATINTLNWLELSLGNASHSHRDSNSDDLDLSRRWLWTSIPAA